MVPADGAGWWADGVLMVGGWWVAGELLSSPFPCGLSLSFIRVKYPTGGCLCCTRRTFEIAEHALRVGLLPASDIKRRERYLYFGLVGSTIVDALFRSLDRPGILLAEGATITDFNCPPEHTQMFQGLMNLKASLQVQYRLLAGFFVHREESHKSSHVLNESFRLQCVAKVTT